MSEHTTILSTGIPALTHVARRRSDAWAAKLSTLISAWIARCGERRALRELAETGDLHMLEDIGVTREQIRYTAAKWFWQP